MLSVFEHEEGGIWLDRPLQHTSVMSPTLDAGSINDYGEIAMVERSTAIWVVSDMVRHTYRPIEPFIGQACLFGPFLIYVVVD